LTLLYSALAIYLGVLAGFLGWWARFPRWRVSAVATSRHPDAC